MHTDTGRAAAASHRSFEHACIYGLCVRSSRPSFLSGDSYVQLRLPRSESVSRVVFTRRPASLISRARGGGTALFAIRRSPKVSTNVQYALHSRKKPIATARPAMSGTELVMKQSLSIRSFADAGQGQAYGRIGKRIGNVCFLLISLASKETNSLKCLKKKNCYRTPSNKKSRRSTSGRCLSTRKHCTSFSSPRSPV